MNDLRVYITALPSMIALLTVSPILDVQLLAIGPLSLNVSDIGVMVVCLSLPLAVLLGGFKIDHLATSYVFFAVPFGFYLAATAISEAISPGPGITSLGKQALLLLGLLPFALSFRRLLDNPPAVMVTAISCALIFLLSIHIYFATAGFGLGSAFLMAADTEALELRSTFGKSFREGSGDLAEPLSVQRNRSAGRGVLLAALGLSLVSVQNLRAGILVAGCLLTGVGSLVIFPSRFYLLIIGLASVSALVFSFCSGRAKGGNRKNPLTMIPLLLLLLLVGIGAGYKFGDYIFSALTFQDDSANTRIEQVAGVWETMDGLPVLGEGLEIWGEENFHNILAASLYQAGLVGFSLIGLWLGVLSLLYINFIKKIRGIGMPALIRFAACSLSIAPVAVGLRSLTGGGATPTIIEFYLLGICLAILSKISQQPVGYQIHLPGKISYSDPGKKDQTLYPV